MPEANTLRPNKTPRNTPRSRLHEEIPNPLKQKPRPKGRTLEPKANASPAQTSQGTTEKPPKRNKAAKPPKKPTRTATEETETAPWPSKMEASAPAELANDRPLSHAAGTSGLDHQDPILSMAARVYPSRVARDGSRRNPRPRSRPIWNETEPICESEAGDLESIGRLGQVMANKPKERKRLQRQKASAPRRLQIPQSVQSRIESQVSSRTTRNLSRATENLNPWWMPEKQMATSCYQSKLQDSSDRCQ